MSGTKVSLVGAAMLLGLVGCGSDGGGGRGDGGSDGRLRTSVPGPTAAVCPDDSTLSYENFGREFMDTYCLGCHSASIPAGSRSGAPEGVNFDTEDEVRAARATIDAVAAAGPDRINVFMPSGANRPSDDERDLLGEWLACGAP